MAGLGRRRYTIRPVAGSTYDFRAGSTSGSMAGSGSSSGSA
jgi:hypothetical protein